MDSIKILISVISNLTLYALDFIFFLLIRFHFEIEIIGQYGIILSFLSLFSFITGLGIEITYLRSIGETNDLESEAKCHGSFLFLRIIQNLIYAIMVLLLSPLLFTNFSDNRVFFLFFIGYILALAGNSFFSFILTSKKRIFKKSLADLINSLFKISFLIIFMNFLIPNLWFLAIIFFTANSVFFLFNLLLIKEFKFKKPKIEDLRDFLIQSYPLFLATSLNLIASQLDILFINSWTSIEDVANYFTAKQIFEMFSMILMGISYILTPIFANNINEGNESKNLFLIKKIHRLLNICVIPLIFVIFLFSTDIFVFVLNDDYRSSGLILSLLSLNLIFISLDLANRVQIRALNEIKFISKIEIFRSSLSILLMVLLMSPDLLNMGAIGGAFSLFLGFLITHVIFRPITYIKFKLGFNWGFFRNLGITVGVIFLQLYLNAVLIFPIYFAPLFIIFDLALYFFFNFLLKGFTIEDIRWFLNVINYKNLKESIFSEFQE